MSGSGQRRRSRASRVSRSIPATTISPRQPSIRSTTSSRADRGSPPATRRPATAAMHSVGTSSSMRGCVTWSRSNRWPTRGRCTRETPPFPSTASRTTAGRISRWPISPPAARKSASTTPANSRGKALDLGCAVGRASFELARGFEQVTGIDFSARFIRIALELKEKGNAHFELMEEGDLVSYHEARLADMGLQEVAQRVEFFQGDATNLKPHFSGYDLVLAANLVDRLVRSEAVPGIDPPTDRAGRNPGDYVALHVAGGIHCQAELAGRFSQRGRTMDDAGCRGRIAGPAFPDARHSAGLGVRAPRNAVRVPAHCRRVDGLAAKVGQDCRRTRLPGLSPTRPYCIHNTTPVVSIFFGSSPPCRRHAVCNII